MNLTETYADGPPYIGRHIASSMRLFLIVFDVLLSISCTFGNSSLLFILLRQPVRRNAGRSHIIFLISLTTADLLSSGHYHAILLADVIIGFSPLTTRALCMASGFVDGVLLTTSAFSLVGISLNRFMNVYFCYAFSRTFTRRRTVAYVVGSWILAFLLNVVGMLSAGGDYFGYSKTIHMCVVRVISRIDRVINIVVMVVPLIVIILLNHFTYKLWQNRRKKLNEAMAASLRAHGKDQESSTKSSTTLSHASSPLQPSPAAKTLDPVEDVNEVDLDAGCSMKARSISQHFPEGRGHDGSDKVDLDAGCSMKAHSISAHFPEGRGHDGSDSVDLDAGCSMKARSIGKHSPEGRGHSGCDGGSVTKEDLNRTTSLIRMIFDTNNDIVTEPILEENGSENLCGKQSTAQVQEQQSERKEVTGLAGPKTTADELGTSGAENEKKRTLKTPDSGKHSQTREPGTKQKECLANSTGRKSGSRSEIKPRARKTTVKFRAISRSMVVFSVGRPMVALPHSRSTPYYARPKPMPEHTSAQSINNHAAFSRSLSVVSVLLAVSMLPYIVVLVLGMYFFIPVEISLFCSSLFFLNNALNWMVYGYMNPVYRRAYANLVPKCARAMIDYPDRPCNLDGDSHS